MNFYVIKFFLLKKVARGNQQYRDVHEDTVAKWSQVILKRRLRWYGYIQRLDDNTPARQALKKHYDQTRNHREDRQQPD